MSKPSRYMSSMTYGITLALLSAIAFFIFEAYFLLILIPITVYMIWNMNNRIRTLERRLAEPDSSSGPPAQSS
jgi:cbb3-type cytochrome oxidase subunit 3